ncbi:hypothetical protein BZA05DRAFT_387681 [Tricharina praecox]|uniref:uncharacterized protein n=1 Tax=Tricharina praecox TaxID=43433 RepID=UPI0022209614|nr:uncharacterized protein BZA05DRAFT_387681 [Tricharina praecox]KAI5857234.1 hypothetical protein BZA05DRAFT_387681 [Tricharina praecox]
MQRFQCCPSLVYCFSLFQSSIYLLSLSPLFLSPSLSLLWPTTPSLGVFLTIIEIPLNTPSERARLNLLEEVLSPTAGSCGNGQRTDSQFSHLRALPPTFMLKVFTSESPEPEVVRTRHDEASHNRSPAALRPITSR